MAAGASRTLELKLVGNAKNLNDTLKKTEQRVGTFGGRMEAFGAKAATAFKVAGVAAGLFAAKLTVDAIKAASDLNEEVSKSRVIFGDAAGAIEEFADSAARTLGQSKTQALAAAAQFGTFGKSAGLTGPALSEFSTRMVTLASDLASFNNATPEETIFAIGAALRGESEPIRRYGVLLNDATLKARAMEMGLYDGVGALDQQARVLAAYQEVLAQTGDAQGDFARTSDGLANQQRILEATFTDLKAQLGEAFLPVAQDVLGWVLDMMPKIEELIPKVQAFIGAMLDRVGEIKDGLQPALDGILEWSRKFIEDATPGTLEAFEELRSGWAVFVDDVKAGYADLEFGLYQLADAFGVEFEGMGKLWGDWAASVGRTIRAHLENLGDLARGFGAFFGTFSEEVAARFRGASAVIDQAAAGTLDTRVGPQYGPFSNRIEDLPGFLQGPVARFRGLAGTPDVPAIYGGYRGGGSYTPETNMNVRIEGLVVDPEGTARAVERILEERRRRMGPRVTAGAFG